MNARAPRFEDGIFIHRPAAQKPEDKLVFRVITILAWVGYLYLWLPLATLGLWWLGMLIARRELIQAPEFVDIGLFAVVAKALLIAIVLLVSWAEYNRIRFQDKERRLPHTEIDPLDSAEAMGASRALGQRLQQARRVVVHLDQEAVPVDVSQLLPLPPSAGADRQPG